MGKNKKNLQVKPVSEKEMVVLDLTNVEVDAPIEKEYQKFKLSTFKILNLFLARFLLPNSRSSTLRSSNQSLLNN